MEKKIFVYDYSLSFNYLLKRYYSDSFQIESHSDRHKVLLTSFEGFEAAFFMIDNLGDFMTFKKVFTNFKFLFVITSVRLFEYEINGMAIDNLTLFDFNDDLKRDIRRKLDFQLKLKKLI